jgi:hypothetical protein
MCQNIRLFFPPSTLVAHSSINNQSPYSSSVLVCLLQAILLDGRGHLLGRLASVIAKTLLQGNRVTVVRTEQINISGNFFR